MLVEPVIPNRNAYSARGQMLQMLAAGIEDRNVAIPRSAGALVDMKICFGGAGRLP